MANTFPSLAGAKVAYLKQLKYQDFQRKRLLAHIRSQVFGSNEYLSFIPTKKTGRKLLQSRLKVTITLFLFFHKFPEFSVFFLLFFVLFPQSSLIWSAKQNFDNYAM